MLISLSNEIASS